MIASRRPTRTWRACSFKSAVLLHGPGAMSGLTHSLAGLPVLEALALDLRAPQWWRSVTSDSSVATMIPAPPEQGHQGPVANTAGVLRAKDRQRMERRALRIEKLQREQREDARAMYEASASLREIAAACHVSHSAIRKWLRKPE